MNEEFYPRTKLTKGQKNALRAAAFKKDVEQLEKEMGVKIYKVWGGINPVYSYKPGGDPYVWDSTSEVYEHLKNKLMMQQLKAEPKP